MSTHNIQVRRIRELVMDHHLAFLAQSLGKGWIDPGDYDRLHKSGMIHETICPEFVEMAFRTGSLPRFTLPSGPLSMNSSESMAALYRIMKSVQEDRQLTEAEREAVDIAKSRMARHVVGLSQKMTKAVRAELAKGLAEGADALAIAGTIAKMTGDANRDWLRVVVTELHTAVQEGRASSLVKKFGGDPLVYKRPLPDACPFCKALYLKKDGVTPRVFRYSELTEKGSNVGRNPNPGIVRGVRKSDDWQPVIGAVHPWCHCEIFHLPDGYIFNDQGKLVPGDRVVKAESVPDLIYHECVSQ